ncbi:hypothetical protein T459_27419 [Capsicum annuum]|uniref:ATPase F1/V1/A1 complex alpha/beta subunit N-terminal domain-containing protein n=1 Tax=Capsicum annuum TaxID=4072 RepID=A0A2G2YDV6_CAPAN|nr:hypothetical protein T459_27419 [Capsicum annuum]
MDDNSSGGRGFSLTDLFSNLFGSSSIANFESGLNQLTLDSPNPGEPIEPPIAKTYYPLQKDGERLRELNERLYFYTFRDEIARVYGLNEIQARKMVGFTSGVTRIALNLENENVGIVVLCSDAVIKEGDLVKCTGSPYGKGYARACGRWLGSTY